MKLKKIFPFILCFSFIFLVGCSAIKKDISLNKSNIDALTQNLDKATKEIAGLKGAVDSVETKCQKKITDNQDKLSNLQAEIKVLGTGLQYVKDQDIEKLRKMIDSLDKIVDELQKAIARWRKGG